MGEGGRQQSDMDLTEHENTWRAFATLVKWSMVGTAAAAFLAGYLAYLWHS